MSHSLVAVAVSGGRDSMSLLHCVARAAAAAGVQVAALHVHHGLMPEADRWAAAVERTCARWSRRMGPIRFSMRRLEGAPVAGDSVEAWARAGRYDVLAAMARELNASVVMLAHHLEDQAETFLLQALRGGGPAGLAAMPGQISRDGVTWVRPWLAYSRQSIEAYARRHRIAYVDDPSNGDPRFARSRLRVQVMPALRSAFPDFAINLSTAAAHAAHAREVLDEVAALDLRECSPQTVLNLSAWETLSEARRRNALKAWLARECLAGSVTATWVDRLMSELLAAKTPAQWQLGGHTVRRYRGKVSITVQPSSTAGDAVIETFQVVLHTPQVVPGAHGTLRLKPVRSGGVPLAVLEGARWRERQGGEQFQRAPLTPPRSLKKQFQAAGVASWMRGSHLLVASDGQLLFVPGLGLDARAQSLSGRPRVELVWEPRVSLPPAV